jgi:hypothetical protein
MPSIVAGKDVTKTKVGRARELLTELTEIYTDPRVRNDPVVKSLIQGIGPKNNDFATASLAVSTLRNAGCLEQHTTNTPTPKEQATKGAPAKVKKEQDTNAKSADAKGKLRSFTKSIDLLLEDAVFRGVAPSKEEHQLAKGLRELRTQGDREIQVPSIKGKYEEGVYANGKKFNKLVSLEKDASGKFIIDETKSTKVKDIGDWDLLALESAELLGIANKLKADLFSWTSASSFRIPADVATVWPSLKGTPLVDLIAGGEPQKAELTVELSKLGWAKFGPSKTLSYPGKSGVTA